MALPRPGPSGEETPRGAPRAAADAPSPQSDVVLASEASQLSWIPPLAPDAAPPTIEHGDASETLLQLRCPHCHHPFATAGASATQDIRCPQCGGSFALVGTTGGAAGERVIAHFQLCEAVGTGGFGTVWKATDTRLQRVVALKTPRTAHLSPAEIERFLNEARAAAQLTHPHIVRVHEVGYDGHEFYIASEFIVGTPLNERLAEQRFTPREAAELCRKLADALQHAHEAGVVHRDLKPGNILLDVRGEPHITDFGLAKRAQVGVAMTVDGCILGTPAYMSPEQARGHSHEADSRSDIYSLGVIFFELLTGERPFRGDLEMLLRQVAEEEPPPPRRLNIRIPRDLETICLKCLEKDPRRRYATAGEVAAELDRFLQGFPIQARPVGRAARFARWCQRRPLVAALSAATCLAMILGTTFSTIGYLQATAAHHRAEESLRRACRAVDDLFTNVSQQELLNEPGMQPLRQRLLELAAQYYEEFAGYNAGDPTLERELAAAHFRLGQIMELLGSPRRADELYAKAAAAQAAMLARWPDEPERLAVYGNTLNARGVFLQRQGQLEAAIDQYAAAIEVREKVAQLAPDDADARRTLANTMMNRSLLQKDLFLLAAELEASPPPAWDRVLAEMQAAQRLREDALRVASDPECRARLEHDLAGGCYNLAVCEQARGQWAAARRWLQEASQRLTHENQQRPSLDATFDLMVCRRLAIDLACQEDAATAEAAAYEAILDEARTLSERNPRVPLYRAEVGQIYVNMALAVERAMAAGRDVADQRLAFLDKGQAVYAELTARHPHEIEYRRRLAAVLRAIAQIHFDAGATGPLRAALEAWHEQLVELHQWAPEDKSVAAELELSARAIEELRDS